MASLYTKPHTIRQAAYMPRESADASNIVVWGFHMYNIHVESIGCSSGHFRNAPRGYPRNI